MKVPAELKDKILDLIDNADWYFQCTGYQNEYDSDLQLDELLMEDGDEVVRGIVKEVFEHIFPRIREIEARLGLQLKHRSKEWWAEKVFGE